MREIVALHGVNGTECIISIVRMNALHATGKTSILWRVESENNVAGPSHLECGAKDELEAREIANKMWAWQRAHSTGERAPFREYPKVSE